MLSVPCGSIALSVDEISRESRRRFEQLKKPRRGKNCRYSVVEVGLSALSVSYTKSHALFGDSAQSGASPRAEQRPQAVSVHAVRDVEIFNLHDFPPIKNSY
jgi:hypothetical protein